MVTIRIILLHTAIYTVDILHKDLQKRIDVKRESVTDIKAVNMFEYFSADESVFP